MIRSSLRLVCVTFVMSTMWATGTPGRAHAVSVVVTVRPLAMLIESVAGEHASVHVLVPPGASPHSFEPKPSDLVRVARADAFLSVGGGLDDWAARLFRTAGSHAASTTLFELTGRRTTPAAAEAPHHSRAHAHDGGEDPHLWLDPILVQREIVPALVVFLSEVDAEHAAAYRERAAQFQDSLERLDREIRHLLAMESRRYVAFHGAWKHFAARYALEQVAVVQEAPGEEPTPRELGSLVKAARRVGLGAILIEPQLDPRIALTLSREFGGTTVLVDPLGDPDDPERSTYTGLLRFNARAFRQAMAQRAEEPPAP